MKIIRKTYNAFFSCSDAAAKLYGEKIIHSDRFRIINNAIPVQAFSFRPDIRGKVRDQYDVDRDRVIIGHVARITIVKNQGFLVDVFYEFHKLVPNSSLWLIGDGECREEIEHRIREKHLEKDVRLFGERKDVPDLMQAMDACVFPSHTEGFCIAAVEAQAAGLPTLASTGLPDECEITGLLRRIELKEGALAWAKTLLSMISGYDRRETGNVLQKSKYDIETAAKELQRFYCGEKI